MSKSILETMARAMLTADADVTWLQLTDAERDRALRVVRAALKAAEEAGWKLVPTKHNGKAGLTHEMCDAFWSRFHEEYGIHGGFEATNAAYNAMLAAAPKCGG